MYRLLSAVIFVLTCTRAMDNLRVAFQWKVIDFQYPTHQELHEALESKEFIPENNIPLGLEVYGDRLFLTIPRWKAGVAASLAFIKLSDPMDSPKLQPYPNWESHKIRPGEDPPQIISPFRIRADRCDRLWVMDTGFVSALAFKKLSPPKLLIYDLNTDQLLRSYTIPEDQIHQNDSFFANIAVEDHDCQNSFAYLADVGHPAIVVYSYQTQKSWMVKHHYFHMNPKAGEMTIGGVTFQWSDGVFGLALSGPDSEGYSTLYFHPMISFNEFSVSTKVLRDENLAKNQSANFQMFKMLGDRGLKAQSGASFLHKKTNVLFYSLLHLNAVACWRTTTSSYSMLSQGRVFMDNVLTVFPNDIKVDANDNLWVLSDRLPIFMYKDLNYTDYNFRVLTAKVADAIRDTACDSKMVLNSTIVNKIQNKVKQNPSSGSRHEISALLLIAFAGVLLR